MSSSRNKSIFYTDKNGKMVNKKGFLVNEKGAIIDNQGDVKFLPDQ